MDCDDIACLLAAGEARSLTTAEEAQLHEHLRGCVACHQLATEAGGEQFRWIARIPGDALEDRDLLVLPTVDPIVFESGPELAHGGMGRILRARDRRLGREVAIKEVLAPGLRARFEREVAITAQLQHPAIVPIYEAGTWPDGTTFYTMRLVSGGTLHEAIARTRTLEDRLALLPKVIAVTEALAYAHERRIIHRDLKPGNVLIGEHGETVVIDWGLAKQLDGADVPAGPIEAMSPELTIAGSVMGTPCFMAPEQAAGGGADERSDVYALGAILYNVLAGAPPYLATGARTPTEVLQLAAYQAPAPIAELAPRTPLDLRAIVDRAMARDPAARYASAKDMAEELRRFEAGQLIGSRAYGLGELILRWVRRHKAAVTVASIALVVVAAVGISAVVGVTRSRAAERDARRAAEADRNRAEANVAALIEEQGRTQLLAGDRERALAYFAEAYHRGRDTAALRHMLAVTTRDLEPLEATTPEAASALTGVAFTADGKLVTIDAGPGAALSIWNGATPIAVHPLGHAAEVARIAASGRRAVVWTGGDTGRLVGHDVATGRVLWDAPAPNLNTSDLQLDPDGERFVVTLGSDTDLHTELRDARSGAAIAVIGLSDATAFSSDGGRVVSCDAGGVCRIRDARSGRVVDAIPSSGEAVAAVAVLGSDGVIVGLGRRAELRRPGRPAIALAGHHDQVAAIAISPRGDRIATGDTTGAIRLWRPSGELVGELRDHRGPVWEIAFSPDGTRLVAGGADHRVYLWDADSLDLVAAVDAFHGRVHQAPYVGPPHRAAVHGVVWAPDARRFATHGLSEGRALVWRAPAGPRVAQFAADAAAAGGAVVATVENEAITIRRVDTGEIRAHIPIPGLAGALHDAHTANIDVGLDGRRAVVWHSNEHRAFTSDLEAGRMLAELTLGGSRSDTELQMSDDGSRIVALPRFVKDADPLRVYDAVTGHVVRELPLSYVAAAALSPDGAYLAVAFAGSEPPRLWRVATGEELPFPGLPADPSEVRFDHAGRRLALFGGESTVIVDIIGRRIVSRLVRPERTGRTEQPDPGHDSAEIHWDVSGRRLATQGSDRVVAVWDVDTGALLGSVDGVLPGGLAIAARGDRLATASFDGRIRIWDAATMRLLEVIRLYAGGGLAWSADGSRLTAVTGDGAATIWDVHLEQRTVAEIDALAARATPWQFADGTLVERR